MCLCFITMQQFNDCTPTFDSNKESIMAFYQNLESVKTLKKIFPFGDFNAKARWGHKIWNTLGKNGLCKMNSNGLHFL